MSRYAALAAVFYEDAEDEDEEEVSSEGVVFYLRGRNGGYRRFGIGEMHAAGFGPDSSDLDADDDEDDASESLH